MSDGLGSAKSLSNAPIKQYEDTIDVKHLLCWRLNLADYRYRNATYNNCIETERTSRPICSFYVYSILFYSIFSP